MTSLACRLLLSTLLLSACAGDDSSTVGGTESTATTSPSSSSTVDSDPTGDTLTSSSSATDTDADTDTSSSSSGGPLDFPPVECGTSTCLAGQVCLQEGIDCDYTEMPPEWVTPTPVCADVPDPCPEASEDEITACLGKALCSAYDGDFTSFKEGVVQCPPQAMDCF